MLKTILLVGAGGFLGSIARYLTQLLSERLLNSLFPWGTFAANMAGCLVIGLVYALAERGSLLPPEWRIFLTVGFCGGFTTFSSFAYHNLMMLAERNLYYFFSNIFLNLFFGLAAVFFGIILVRLIWH
ncbi:MAG: fluoride efflux transporter CrcB [Mangrovibacterium sp.]